MDWKERLDDTTDSLRKLKKVKPEIQKGFGAMHHAALEDGALSVKDKELQAVAIAIVKQCDDCIGFHVGAALREGATRGELAETIGVAVLMGGGPAYMYGAHAMEAFDALS